MPPTWKITIPDYSNSHKIFRTTTLDRSNYSCYNASSGQIG